MHYMDELFFPFSLSFIGRVHASCCVVTCYLWTEARRHERKEMGLVSLTKKEKWARCIIRRVTRGEPLKTQTEAERSREDEFVGELKVKVISVL